MAVPPRMAKVIFTAVLRSIYGVRYKSSGGCNEFCVNGYTTQRSGYGHI